MGDKGEDGIKNLKKGVTPFMNGLKGRISAVKKEREKGE